MPLNAEQFEQALARTVRLKTMGFGRHEIRPILEAEFRIEIDDTEYLSLYHQMTVDFSVMPGIREIKESLGETWARQDGLLADLLGLYQLLVQHFNAYMSGQTLLDDGTSVRAVKAGDILQVVSLITKLGQDGVTSKLNTLQILPALDPPAEAPRLPSPSKSLDALVDDEDDLDEAD